MPNPNNAEVANTGATYSETADLLDFALDAQSIRRRSRACHGHSRSLGIRPTPVGG